MRNNMSYIKGNFRKTIFKSDKGYTVGLFKVREIDNEIEEFINKTITFTGYFYELNENDYYLFNGEFKDHERYGMQFVVSSYEVIKPTSKDAIIEFLSSDLFKGIGEKKAEKIVTVLGEDCLSTIENNPSCLLLVPTVTEKQKNIIYDNLIKYQSSYSTILFLTEIGFNTKESLEIYYAFKDKTKDIVTDNIYNIIDNVNGISFKKIDALKSNLNVSIDDDRRIKAGIKYVMAEVANNVGDVYLFKDELINYTMRALDVKDYEKIENSIIDLISIQDIVQLGEKYYLKSYYMAEKNISKRLCNLSKIILPKVDLKYVDQVEKDLEITFNSDQIRAVKSSLEEAFVIITGGPGTGKTTIIKAITELYMSVYNLTYQDLVKDVALLAPTGRASKRMSETTHMPAATIHRFLKWDKETDTFAINEENKAEVKMIIIDEASMIDVNLFNSLLAGIPYDCKVVLVGDYDQLPSVGPGQVLKDLIECDMFSVIKLKELYRQAKDSNIIKLAYDINNQTFDLGSLSLGDDLEIIECSSNNLKEYLKPIISQYNKSDYFKFQVLAPIYAYESGIDDLNIFIQNLLNPSTDHKEIMYGEKTYREGDKILQLVNMPDENVFNGDLGYLDVISTKPKEMYVNYDSGRVKYTPSIFQNITHGFVISIHKAQGSEFDTVIIPVLNKYSRMLYKKLIYTAVTRAKKKLYILGEIGALQKAILNDSYKERKTTLKTFIIDSINNFK